jgi:elongation factor P hydroxylase
VANGQARPADLGLGELERRRQRQAFVSGFVTQLTAGDDEAVFFPSDLAEDFAAEAAKHFNEDGKMMFEVRIWEEEG